MNTDVVLEAREVSVQYPGTLALDSVSFRLHRGKVSALIGENGAGKSTLVGVLAGIVRPTRGRLRMDGVEVSLDSVRRADALGIGIIHQELNLCPNLSVAENIFLARELTRHGVLDKRGQQERARRLLARLEQPIDPTALVGDLPLGQQQIVEIAKALARNVRVLMMDEPTSALSAGEIAVLFRIIRDLAAHGVAVVYISHRLEELLEISDYVSVLRDGRMVAEAAAADVDARWLVEKMTGRPAGSEETAGAARSGPELLRVEGLSLTLPSGRPVLQGVSLSLHAGEILGVYGLMGAGRTELLECLMGLHPEVAGSVFLDSRRLGRLHTSARIAAGMAIVPEARQVDGLVPSISVLANMTLSGLAKFSRGAWLSPAAERTAAAQMVNGLRIKTAGLGLEIGSLSGGNQQKVIIARCLLTGPRVLLLDEPTRGVDVGAKREIHSIIRRLAEEGMGVILVSSELEEVRAAAHRIVVMSRGRVTAEFAASQATDSALAEAAS
ncbi:MAG: sugar ABC transporter ATP-binding protein [Bryobacterales bacterium]|nr:sugar ABC transporter ATP-binding protein [Bryobacterales bacterium]